MFARLLNMPLIPSTSSDYFCVRKCKALDSSKRQNYSLPQLRHKKQNQITLINSAQILDLFSFTSIVINKLSILKKCHAPLLPKFPLASILFDGKNFFSTFTSLVFKKFSCFGYTRKRISSSSFDARMHVVMCLWPIHPVNGMCYFSILCFIYDI